AACAVRSRGLSCARRDTSRVARWCPEDQHDNILLDVVEAVNGADPDEDDAAGADWPLLTVNRNPRPAADDVADLVLGVGPLCVNRAGRPDCQTEAEGAGSEDLRVDVLRALVGCYELRDLKGVHGAQGSFSADM